jgi:TRAP-type C4-dicarboxylate transport system permease large subunit
MSGYTHATTQWFAESGLPGTIAMLILALGVLLGSSIIGSVAMLFIATPFVMPTLLNLGFSPESVGLMLAVSLALGPLIPPIGPLFVSLAAGTTAGKKEVIKGVTVYMICGISMFALIIIFPNLIDRMSKWLF